MYSKWDLVLLAAVILIFVAAGFFGWWIIIIALIPFLGIYIQEMHVGERLQQSEERYRKLVDASPDAIVVLDKTGVIRVIDDQTKVLFRNKTRDEVIGRSGFDFVIPEDRERMQKELGRLLTTGSLKGLKYTSLRLDGSKFPTVANASVISDSEGNPESIMLILHDVTKELEIDTAKTDFFAAAAHQLRTPLSTLRWEMELLSNRKTPLTEERQKQVFKRMYSQVLRLIDVVNTMLDSSLLEQGIVRTHPERVVLNVVIGKTLKEFSEMSNGHKVKIDYSHGRLGEAYLDPLQLGDVVSNLITNAVKYSGKENEVKVTATRQGQVLHIEVADNGFGIPKEEQPLIFTKFYRTKQAKKVDPEGSGLGLYVIKSYIDAWGGTIRFKSPMKEGRGTTFYIDIPLKEVV